MVCHLIGDNALIMHGGHPSYGLSTMLQSEERQVGHVNVNLDIDIFVISEPKWLKFGLQAHFFKMFGHAKFQLSIFFTLTVMKLLVEVFSDFH